jgi:hypothetical protein
VAMGGDFSFWPFWTLLSTALMSVPNSGHEWGCDKGEPRSVPA